MPRAIKPKRRELVYAGAANHGGELVHAYFVVTPGDMLSEKAEIYPTALGDFPPGAVVSYEVHQEGAIHLKGAEFERMWPDAKLTAEWTARHSATLASEAAWACKDLPGAFACMEPVRAAYRLLKDEELRGVLVAQMVRYVVSPDDQ